MPEPRGAGGGGSGCTWGGTVDGVTEEKMDGEEKKGGAVKASETETAGC